ncbi:MAG: primase-helicase family protein [Xanthobacteraceae bacterium]
MVATTYTLEQFETALGGVEEKHSSKTGLLRCEKGSKSKSRLGLDDRRLRASHPELVIEAIRTRPNTAENNPTRADFVKWMIAIKAALGPKRENFYGQVLEWALDYPDNDGKFVRQVWDSIKDAELGADWLFAQTRAHGFSGDAQDEFADPPYDAESFFTLDADAVRGRVDELATLKLGWPDAYQEVLDYHEMMSILDVGELEELVAREAVKHGAAGNSIHMPAKTAIECAIGRYIWCSSLERFYDEETGQKLTANAFNAENVSVADYGRGGMKSAAAVFQNTPGARKVHTTTYRVGAPLLVQEGKVIALNLWRPSGFVPALKVSDADVKQWLDHMKLIFGPYDGAAMRHILDVMAFWVQRPGHKLNHSIVIYGSTQGTGKDTSFVPLVRYFGDDNVVNIQPEAIAGQFNDFLCSQICFVNEMINFEKKAIMNRMKPWLASPPTTITINKKFAQPFTIPNVVNWVIYTNYHDAIRMDDTDRRFWVHECLLDTPMPVKHYDELYSFYDNGGAEKVIGWLQQRDISDFNPKASPPMTDAKREMISSAMPPGSRWVRDQFVDGETFAGRTVLTIGEVLRAANQDFSASQCVNHRNAATALRAEGFMKYGRHRAKIDGDVRQLWVRDPSGQLKKSSADEIRERYVVEIKGSSIGKAA